MPRITKKSKPTTTPQTITTIPTVPVAEQPYRVPENWRWVYGKSIMKPMEVKRPTGNVFKYIDIDSIDNKRQIVSEPKTIKTMDAPSRASRALHPGDTVFSMVRPYLKNIAYIDSSIADSIASSGFYVCSPINSVNKRYNYYLMISPYVIDGLNAFMKGDNSPSIRKDDLEQFPFPLPPLAEQQRIVDRIERLFAQLDEAREKAQAVVDAFEDRKATILHKAFTGELTKRWREERGIGIDSWERIPLNTICERIFDGPFGSNLKSDDYVENGIRVVRLENIKNLWFDDSKKSFVTKEKYKTIDSHTVIPTDLIMSTFIADEIKICQMPSYIGFAINKADCIGIRLKQSVHQSYILYFLSSKDTYNHLIKMIHGATRPRVNTKQIKEIAIPLACSNEQDEIVRVIDNLFAQEQRARDLAESVIAQIDVMKKAILARAFRGELGTNDTSESACEM